MDTQEMAFDIGDSVVVRPGVEDPDFGSDISGWQGRVADIRTGDPHGTVVQVEWDSITLQEMNEELIVQCEVEGLDWARTYLLAEELMPAEPRDKPGDATRVAQHLADRFEWAYLGKQGMRIGQVLQGLDEDDEMGQLEAWAIYLEARLAFPFVAEVAEYQERGPFRDGDRVKVTGFDLVDDTYGIIADVEHKGRDRAIPLADLEVPDEGSPNYEPVDDYVVWFANQ